MKMRNGFVSNSSSSSFIVAFKRGKKCKHCGVTPQDLEEFVGAMREGYVSDIVFEDLGYLGTDREARIRSAIDKALTERYVVKHFNIDNNDREMLEAMITNRPDAKILERWES